MERVEVGLGLGSNIGDKAANIREALRKLEAKNVLELTALSSIYRTDPWGNTDQDFFANACALGQTRLDPQALLAACQAVEAEMGRVPSAHWGPRLIDIDFLFYGDVSIETETLVLPHKEIFKRAFVLVPLAEIAPELKLAGRPIAEAAAHCLGHEVTRWEA